MVVSLRRWLVLLLGIGRLHVNRSGPLLAPHGADGFSFFRARGSDPMVQLGSIFNFVQILARGGEWRPDLLSSIGRLHFNRSGTFLEPHGAGGLGFFRARGSDPMVQLVGVF